MGSRGILQAGRVRALAGVAALLALVLAWPAGAQVVCVGGGCGGGGTVTSPVATDPLSLTGAVTFDNAANTPLVCSDGLQDSTLTAGRVTFAGASGRLADDADLTFATDTLTATKINVKAGTGSGSAAVGGVLCKAAPGTATTGTSEEVLATCPIPAGTLAVDGAKIRVRFFMTTAATANNRTVFVRIGASGTCTPGTCQIVYQSLTAQPNAQRVYFLTPLTITRQTSTTATAEAYLAYSPDATPTSGTTSYGTYLDDNASVTWGNALDLVISATTATAAGGVTLSNYSVSWEP